MKNILLNGAMSAAILTMGGAAWADTVDTQMMIIGGSEANVILVATNTHLPDSAKLLALIESGVLPSMQTAFHKLKTDVDVQLKLTGLLDDGALYVPKVQIVANFADGEIVAPLGFQEHATLLTPKNGAMQAGTFDVAGLLNGATTTFTFDHNTSAAGLALGSVDDLRADGTTLQFAWGSAGEDKFLVVSTLTALPSTHSSFGAVEENVAWMGQSHQDGAFMTDSAQARIG